MAKKNRNRNRDQQNKTSSTGGNPSQGADDADENDSADGEVTEGSDAIAKSDSAAPEAASENSASATVTAVVGESAAAVHNVSETAAAGSATANVSVVETSDVAKPAPAKPVAAVAAPVAKRPSTNPALAASLAPLVERLRAGKCVLWAGSGLDEAAGGVGFRTIVERMLSTLPDSDETKEARELLPRRPFLVAGFVKRRLGDGFNAALREAAKGPVILPAEIKALGEMPFRAVLTTGFSDLLRRGFTRGDDVPHVYTAHTVGKREGRGRFLLKALGDPEQAGSVVFSARDLQGLLGEEGLATVVRDFYRNRSILFIGVDPPVDVDRLFVRLLQGTPLEGVEHYAVLPGYSKMEREELENSYRLKIIDESDVLAVIRVLREELGDLTEALPDDEDLEGWMGLLAGEPDRADAVHKLAALEASLTKKNDHERLLELHLGMTELETTHTARARRLHEVAKLFESHFADPARAFTALVAAFKEDPEHDRVSDLERLAEKTNSWTELLGEYVHVAPNLQPKTRADHWVRVSRLYSEKLRHHEYAIHAVDEALKLDAAHTVAKSARVELLRKAEKWVDLVPALAELVKNEQDRGKQSEFFLELGDLYETRLGDGVAAAKAYRDARASDAGSIDALHALEQLHRRRAEWKELVAVLDEKSLSAEASRALELRLEAAALVADKLDNRKDAIARYEALRSDNAGLAALHALEKLYQADGRTDDYLEVLAAQAEVAKDNAERIALYRRLAVEWEDRPSGRTHAAGYYEKLLALDGKSEEAYRAVERIYQADQKWEALIDAYKRHAELSAADRLAINISIARTFETEVKDPLRAIDAWNVVIKMSPNEEAALEGLTRLYVQTEAWQKAITLIDQRVEGSKDKELRTRLLHQSADIALDRLSDGKQAEERYHRALEIDHTYVPAMTAMVELYRKSGEFLRAAKLLVEAETFTVNRLEKTRLLVEAGEIYDELEQHVTATDLYLRAMAVDPEHVEAGNRVSELLWKAERWADLTPILEMLARKEADKGTMKTRFLRLGRAARETGANEKAARAYVKAAELDPTDVEAQRACGQLFFIEHKWSEAREAFKAVLGHGGDDLKDAERVDLYFRLGECDRKLGQLDKAKNFYAKALEIDPTHRPTILARIDVDGDDPQKIIEAKRALLATASTDEKVKLLTEIGESQQEKLKDAKAAAATWREAIEIKPDARSLLHNCLEVYVEEKDWQQSLTMLSRLTELEAVPSIRAKLRFTSAVIHLEELNEVEPAVKLLTDANDDDPSAVRISQKLEELLLQTQAWKDLQRHYRKLIKRMPPETESDAQEIKNERLHLWSALADVSIDKLGEIGVGLPALEVTTGLEPANLKRREQLAELYVQGGPEYADKAITAHQTLLRTHHDRIPSYRALRQLYAQTKQPDKALAVAYALSFLKKGAPEDEAMVLEAKKKPLQPAKRNLDEDLWTRCLAHPDEDRFVSALFSALLPTLALANGKQHKDIPLLKKDFVENTDPRGFAKGIRYVAGALNVTMPYEVYVKYEQRDPITVENAIDPKMNPVPAMVVGQPLLGDKRSERELVFELTKRLAHFRTDRYLRYVLGSATQLGLVIDAAIAMAAEMDREKVDIGKIGQDLKRSLSPKVLEQVATYGRKLKGQKSDALATAWLAATELTAARAAFILVGDLETTARFLAAEPAAVSSHAPVYRLKEIIWFSVTEECFTMRKHLGLMA